MQNGLVGRAQEKCPSSADRSAVVPAIQGLIA